MPFSRSPLSDLRSQSRSDLAASLPGSDPLLRFSILGVLADMLAAGVNANYGYLDWIARQSVPFTATGEALEAWAAIKAVVRKPAVAATGTAAAAGGTLGVTLSAGAPLSRGDGAAFVTTQAATVAVDGSISVLLAAVSPGSAGTIEAGSLLVLDQAVSGIPSSWTATGVTPGVDVETDDALRTRMLQAYANPPQGGAASDYETWALEVPGVTRSWTVPNGQGPGTVSVYFMMDAAEAVHGGFPQGTNGVASAETRDTPATGDQLTVANAILPLQPVTALVYAYAPGQNVVTFTISLPGATDTVKAAVAAAIDAAFLAYGAPGATVDKSDVQGLIGVLAGTRGYVITAEACSHGSVTPTDGNIVSAAGYLPVRGAVTWI